MASKIICKHRRGSADAWKSWLVAEGNKLEDGEIGIIDADLNDYPNHLRLLVGDGKEHSYEEMPKFAYAQEENDSVVSKGYDYAEYFKWASDVAAEDRISGRFVTIAENTRTIRLAQPNDKILGITSKTASIIGNWDENNRLPADGWAIVGMLGIVEVQHDHTCTKNGYAMIGEDGIATKAEDAFGYKVVNVDDEAGTIEVVLGNDSDMISRIKSELNRLNIQVDIINNSYAKSAEIRSHVDNMNNPHQITADQLNVYTKLEVDNTISQKSDINHLHDDRYYTESEINAKIAEINQAIEDTIADISGDIVVGIYETKTDASAKLEEAKAYTDSAKSELLNGADEAHNSLKKLGDMIDANQNAIGELTSVVDNKASIKHDHDDAYYTEAEIDDVISTIHDDLENIINGDTVVAAATYAASSTKATKDASGNIITETYETKSGSDAKFNEAKAYTDTTKSNLIDGAAADYNTFKKLENKINYLSSSKQDAIMNIATQRSYTATVNTTWTESGGYYYQDIAIEGILDTDTPIVDILPGNDNTLNVMYSDNMCKVFRITTSNNSIRVWATKSIDSSFPIQLKVVR